MLKRIFFCVIFFKIQLLSAQILPPSGPSPQAGPVNPPSEYNTIRFDFDLAGNQIKRQMIYLSSKQSNVLLDSVSTANIVKEKFLESDEYSAVKYYPNPVRSELFLDWGKTGKTLQTIEIYDLNGKLVRSYKHQTSFQNAAVNFELYPVGIYNLVLIYVDSEKQTFKIVKQ